MPIAPRKAASRSAVANGSAVVCRVDGRSSEARRLRDLISDLTAELGGSLSQIDQLRVRAAAIQVVHAEHLTADLLNGKPVDSEELTRASNSASRLLNALRAGKAKRPTGPSLRDQAIARHKEAAQ